VEVVEEAAAVVDVPHHHHHHAAEVVEEAAVEVAEADADPHHHHHAAEVAEEAVEVAEADAEDPHHHHHVEEVAEEDFHQEDAAEAAAVAADPHHHHPHPHAAAEAASLQVDAVEEGAVMLLQPHLMLPQPHQADTPLPKLQLLPHNTAQDLLTAVAAVAVTLKPEDKEAAAVMLAHKLPLLAETLMLDASKWHHCATSNSHSLSSNIISIRFIISDRIGNETAPKTNLVFLHLLVLSLLFVCCSPHHPTVCTFR